MIAFVLVLLAAVIDLVWVAARVRREWAQGDELSRASGVAISSLYVLAMALLALALVLRPWPLGISQGIAIVLGVALVVAGLALALLGARLFGSSARLYGVETGGLVEGGIYRFSRNPQYVGLIMIAIGVAALGRSALTLAVAAFVAVSLWLWVRVVEEPHLSRVFGDRYRRYRAAVPRVLGLPRASQ